MGDDYEQFILWILLAEDAEHLTHAPGYAQGINIESTLNFCDFFIRRLSLHYNQLTFCFNLIPGPEIEDFTHNEQGWSDDGDTPLPTAYSPIGFVGNADVDGNNNTASWTAWQSETQFDPSHVNTPNVTTENGHALEPPVLSEHRPQRRKSQSSPPVKMSLADIYGENMCETMSFQHEQNKQRQM